MAKKKRSSRKVAGKRLTKKVGGKNKPGKAGAKKPASKKGAGRGHHGPLGSPKERTAEMLRFARRMFDRALADWPEGQLTTQAGAAGQNHALWLVGHLAVVPVIFFGTSAGLKMPELPEGYKKVFFDEPPVDDPSRYPSMSEVKGWYERVMDALIEGVEAEGEAALAEDVREATGGFASDRLQLVEQAAWHVGWHFGQLTALRRALGMKSIM